MAVGSEHVHRLSSRVARVPLGSSISAAMIVRLPFAEGGDNEREVIWVFASEAKRVAVQAGETHGKWGQLLTADMELRANFVQSR